MTFRTATGSLRYLTGVILMGSCPLAIAQYVWIDAKGIKQFSDRPPPPSVPDQRILKAPDKPQLNPNTAPAAAPPAEAAGTAPQSLAAREQAFQRRRAEADAAEQKAGETARQKADSAANCDAARHNQLALDQGIRIANVDRAGERGIMSERERAEFGKKNQKVLAGCQ